MDAILTMINAFPGDLKNDEKAIIDDLKCIRLILERRRQNWIRNLITMVVHEHTSLAFYDSFYAGKIWNQIS